MTLFPTELPVIAVSRCLLGQRVRYDGGDKRQTALAEHVAASLPLRPLCPEWDAGLGVPRPPLRLQHWGADVRVLTVVGGLDRTVPLHAACLRYRQMLLTVDGLVLKSRSPSCGIDDTPLHPPPPIPGEPAVAPATGPGLLLRSGIVPDTLPRTDEQRLADPLGRERFFTAVFSHWRQRLAVTETQWQQVLPLLQQLISAS